MSYANLEFCTRGNNSFGSLWKYESGNRARQGDYSVTSHPKGVRGAYVKVSHPYAADNRPVTYEFSSCEWLLYFQPFFYTSLFVRS
ncbi:hypothetical protein PUN28_014285 [Cardiocondyla obscurior]|uniref:Uncharacterized protein n=1 Tax=Cardiocondyla obscurior TaxID=286306 RepID=A0AAW2F4B9_9HYME